MLYVGSKEKGGMNSMKEKKQIVEPQLVRYDEKLDEVTTQPLPNNPGPSPEDEIPP